MSSITLPRVYDQTSLLYKALIDPAERAGKTFLQVLLVMLVPQFATHNFTFAHDFTTAGLAAACSVILTGITLLANVKLEGFWDLFIRAAKTFLTSYIGVILTNGVVDGNPAHWVAALTVAIGATCTSLLTNLGALASPMTLGASSVMSVRPVGFNETRILPVAHTTSSPANFAATTFTSGFDGPRPPVTEPSAGVVKEEVSDSQSEEEEPLDESVILDPPDEPTPRQLAARKAAATRRANAAKAAKKKKT